MAESTDWGAVRAAYEGTTLSLRALAAQFGISSENTIRRKRDREGWTRDEAAIAQKTAQAVVEHVRGDVRSAHVDVRMRTGEGDADPALAGVRESSVRTDGPKRPPDAVVSVVHADVREAAGPVDLVAEQVKAQARQLKQARAGIATASMFFELLREIASGQVHSPEFRDAQSRLTAINLDKDTLSSLVKSFTGMFEACVKLERTALGLDAAPGVRKGEEGAPAAGAHTGPITPDMLAAMRLMGEDMLMGLRTAAVQVSRQGLPPAPPTIEGQAE